MHRFVINNSFLVILLLLLGLHAFGQHLQFQSFDGQNNLPSGSPQCLLQDRQGFLWIGTTDGLNRYDGKRFKEFYHIRNDSTSISNNYIISLKEGHDGKIWVGTQRGLNCFDPATGRFQRFIRHGGDQFEAENTIHCITEDSKGYIWYGTYNGLFRLNPHNKDWLQFLPQVENANSISNQIIWKIFEDSKGKLWIGTRSGLTVYDNDGSFNFTSYLPEPENPNGLKTERIFEFIEQPDGTIWLGTEDGLFKVVQTKENLRFQNYAHDPDDNNSLSHNYITSLAADGDNRIWAATWNGGLNELVFHNGNKNDIRFIHHRHDPKDPMSINIDLVKTIYLDRSGMLWVGATTGLQRMSPYFSKFNILSHNPNDPASLSNEIVKSVCKDSRGNLWVGTREGLNFLSAENFDKKNFEFIIFKHLQDDPSSISYDNIFGLHEDDQGYFWIATSNGLNYINLADFDPDNPKFQHFNTKDGLPTNWIYNILQISGSEYWIATYGQLSKMSFKPEGPEKTSFHNYDMDNSRDNALVNATTYAICKDRFGDQWIATFDGLSKYVQRDGGDLFDNYKNEIGDSTSLSNNSIITMHLDKKGRLWIGTRGGLNLVLQQERDQRAAFKIFGKPEGLPNEVIQAIEEDENGNLWIGTNAGLVVFDPEKAVKGEKAVMKIYDKNDGMAESAIVFRSSFRDNTGQMYFGSAAGLIYFNPSHLPENTSLPVVVFTDLKILNKSVVPSFKKDNPLKKAINLTDTITLKYWQNILSIEFAAIDFTKPGKNQYAYQLEGFDAEWVEAGNNNTATYTNLEPGTYLFKAKGSNNDGLWNETPNHLVIHILPPPWKTWWAYSIYVLALIGGLYLFIKNRVRKRVRKIEEQAKIEKARFEERELLRKQNAADFHDELGHRLTKISLFLELADRNSKDADPAKQYLSKIKANTSGLSDGIRDLIWSLDPQKDSLYQTLLRLQEAGDKIFDFSTVKFKTKGISVHLEQVFLEPDVRKQILMIFKEAMNNCLKYADCKNADLEIELNPKTCKIIFKDDGKGFDQNKISKGYGLDNLKQRAEKINAELLITTAINQGTSITLILKIPQMG